MSWPPGRWWLAVTLLAVTCPAVGAAVPAERADFEESWWLCKLGSANRRARVRAAEALVEMRCIRAVPRIVRVIADDREETISVTGEYFVTARCSRGAPLAIEKIESAHATPVIHALWTLGQPALPALRRCLAEKRLDARTRNILRRLLDRSEPLERLPRDWRES